MVKVHFKVNTTTYVFTLFTLNLIKCIKYQNILLMLVDSTNHSWLDDSQTNLWKYTIFRKFLLCHMSTTILTSGVVQLITLLSPSSHFPSPLPSTSPLQ